MRAAKLFEVHPLVAADGEQVIAALFIVAEEKVLRIPLRVGDFDLGQFGHIENGFMLGDFVPDAVFGEKSVNFLLVHARSLAFVKDCKKL